MSARIPEALGAENPAKTSENRESAWETRGKHAKKARKTHHILWCAVQKEQFLVRGKIFKKIRPFSRTFLRKVVAFS